MLLFSTTLVSSFNNIILQRISSKVEVILLRDKVLFIILKKGSTLNT
jgi:hypothetical protein